MDGRSTEHNANKIGGVGSDGQRSMRN